MAVHESNVISVGKVKIETKAMVRLAKDAAMFLMERLVKAGPSGKLRFSDDPFVALSGFPFHLFHASVLVSTELVGVPWGIMISPVPCMRLLHFCC